MKKYKFSIFSFIAIFDLQNIAKVLILIFTTQHLALILMISF